MKVVILILALVAVAYAAPVDENAMIEAFFEKLLASQQQASENAEIEDLLKKDNEQENEEEQLLSLLAQMQAKDNENAILEALFAQEQAPPQMQAKYLTNFKNYIKRNGPDIAKEGLKYLFKG